MIKRVFTYFCLLSFCSGLIMPTERGKDVILRPGCLAPFWKSSPVEEAVVDESSMKQIYRGVVAGVIYRAQGFLVGADRRRRPASLIIKKLYLDGKSEIESFENETRVFSALASNPVTSRYVPRLYSVKRRHRDGFIVMEDLCSGPRPFAAMDDEDVVLGLTPEERGFVLRELASVVAAFHVAGYVHHDLSLSNIYFRFVTDFSGHVRAEVKIIDFQFSRGIDRAQKVSTVRNERTGVVYHLKRSAREIAAMKRETIVAENIAVDIKKLGSSFLFFLVPLKHYESMRDLNPAHRVLFEQVTDAKKRYYRPLKMLKDDRLRGIILHMLIPPEKGQYSDMAEVISELDSTDFFSVAVSAISRAA